MIFFDNLKKQKDIVHAIMERKDGSVNPFSNPNSEENILNALKKLDLDNYTINNLIYAEQIHKANIHIVLANNGGYIKLDVDSLITKNSDQILITKTADCVPILLYDRVKKIVAAIHGGRKPLVAGIIPNAISLLKKNFDSSPEDFIVGIGPHIRKCCYWLHKDTLKGLKNGEWKEYFIQKNNKAYFDLTQLAIDQLIGEGILKNNIEDCGICTFCKAERFFSARKVEESSDFYKKENERFPCFGGFIGLKK